MDIKDSYLHGTIGVVKSISVNEDKLTYTLADINQTTTTVTLPTATQTANGLLSSTDKIKLDTSTGINQSIPYIVGPTTDTTAGTWTGTYAGITDYTEGLTIIYVPNVAGASTTTLNINGIGSKVCYYTGASKVTTHYPAGTPILFTYSGGGWKRADYYYDSLQLRVYRQTTGYDADYPILVSRTLASSIGTSGSNNSYSNVYSLIGDDSTKTPTINPLTGEIKAPKFTGTFNGTASSVTNSLILKINSGSTEGTNLYTYNGAANKTLDIKQGDNVTLTATEDTLIIAASDSKVTQSDYTGSSNLQILLSYYTNNDTTASVRKSSKLTFNPSSGLLTTPIFKGDWTYTSDSRSVATIPSDYKSSFKFVGIKDPSVIGLTSTETGSWVSLFGWKGYYDNTGPHSWELASDSKERIWVRSGVGIRSDGSGNEDWKDWHKLAYTSDIPTKVSQLTNDSGYVTGGPYLPLSGGIMDKDAYISWTTLGNPFSEVISDWSTVTGDGIRVFSSTTTDSGAPATFCTALHVKGSYGFQIAGRGGSTSNDFFIRNISSSLWNILIHSNNYTSYLGYIGTTAVQANSANQELTGITNATISGTTTSKTTITKQLVISSTDNERHLTFSRESANYIIFPETGYLAFGTTNGEVGIKHMLTHNYFAPYNNVTSNLGTNSRKWNTLYVNNIYTSDLVSDSSTINGDLTLTTNTAITPKLRFQRRTATDSYYDYYLYASSDAKLVLGYNNNGTDTDFATFYVDGHYSGNSATTNKLKTAVTLWGQSFDGSSNVNGNITFDNEQAIIQKLPRVNANGGGWASDIIVTKKADDSYLYQIGVYGVNVTPYYMYLGFQGHNGLNNFRIYQDGVRFGTNIILHEGNYNLYSPKLDGTGATGTWGINITGSAAKLTTPRTLWGQSFDGTGNVTGDMTGVGSINRVFKVISTQDIAQLNVSEESSTVNYSHLYVSSNNTSNINTRPLVLQNGYGNVGIGLVAPTEKLEVNGNVKATSFIGNLDWSYIQNKPSNLPANGGDADTVDGKHASDFLQIYNNNIDDYTQCISLPRIKISYITGQGDFGSLTIPTFASNRSDYFFQTELRFDNRGGLKYRNLSHIITDEFKSLLDSLNYTNYVNTINFPGLNKTGTVTSVGLSVPTGFSVSSSSITTSGTLGITFASGYSLPTTAKQNNWDTVYNWYTSITATDTDVLVNKWGEIVDFLDSVAEGTDITDEFVTRKTNQTITGLKTFESNSSTTGVSLILKNKGWSASMSTAMDFYNGSVYTVPNARIETKMVNNGTSGGTLIFYTQTKHASTNPNPNGLTERFRISDDGLTSVTGDFSVSNDLTVSRYLKVLGQNVTYNSTSKFCIVPGTDAIYLEAGNNNFTDNVPLYITGYNGRVGNSLYLRYSNIYTRDGNYINIDSGNYNSYSPKLDGTGATGTWNIDINGSAKKLNNLSSSDFVRSYQAVGANYTTGSWIGYTYVTDEHGGAITGGLISAGTNSYYSQLNGSVNSHKLFYRYINSGNASDWKQLAFIDNIPTLTSQLTNDSGFLVSDDLTNYVTLDTNQTITGVKKFQKDIQVYSNYNEHNYGVRLLGNADCGWLQFGQFTGDNRFNAGKIAGINGVWLNQLNIYANESIFSRSVTATKFITSGGTSSQFVKGDGSLDSNTYATSTSLNNYLPLSGGTLSGLLTINNTANDAFDQKYISLTNNSVESARIGISSHSALGLYAKENIYLRPNSSFSASTYGLVISSTSLTYNGQNVLHAGNYSSYALPLTGGTLSGNLTLSGDSTLLRNIKFDYTSGWAQYICALQVDNVTKFVIAGYGSYTVNASDNDIHYVYMGCNNVTGLNLRISSTELKWGDNPILHSGNYTSYTPILNSSSTHATNTSVIYAPTTAGTSGQYLMSNGSGAPVWASLSALANPYAIKFKNSAGTEVSYNGSQAIDLTGGVYESVYSNISTKSNYIGSYAHTNTCGIKYYYCGAKGDDVDVTGKYVGYNSTTTTYQSILRLQSHITDQNSLWYIDLIFDVNNGNIWERRVSAGNTPILKQIAWTSDIPATLKNPYSITFTNTTGTVITYDGSTSVDLSSGINYATKSSVANNGIFYIEGTGTTAGTWLGEHDEIKELYKGLTIAYKIPIAGASPTTLKINNLQAVTCYYNANSYLTTHYSVGSVILLVYDGTYFRVSDYDSIHIADCYTTTASSTAAKSASATYYKLRTGNLFICTVYRDNTAAAELTLNINSTGAKPIWINGTASSATNYTLPAGRYLVYYDGTNYYFYTNGGVKIPQVYGNASSASVLQTSRKIWGQSFDGSGNIEGDLTIMARDTDKSIQFLSGGSGSTHNWRIAYIGTGTGDTNYLSFESTKATANTWEPALQLGCTTLNATFAGTVTAPNFVQNSNGISDFTNGIVQIKTLNALTNETATTYAKGSAGQILRSNGTNVYWSDLSKLTSTAIKTNQSYSLKNSSWEDTGYSISGLETGSYMIQVISTNMVASGIFSVQKSLTDTMGDEIPLHVYGSAGWRPYLRTYGTKLEISANHVTTVSRTVTIKIVQII